MDHIRAPDTQESKVDKRPTVSNMSTKKVDSRAIRRVRSPSRPRAWLSRSYKPKSVGQAYKPRFPRDDRFIHKVGFSTQRHQQLKPQTHIPRRNHLPNKRHHITPKERGREKERERERSMQRESSGGSSPSKPNNTSRAVPPRSSSSRDKDLQFTVFQDERNQSRERDHRTTTSKDREWSRDGELPLTASQTAARDRAIQQKRREIDEVYYQECEMFGLVAKMLIAKDPALELPIQSSLQENLRDIGKRCIEAMEKFIEDYDSRELLHYLDK
uniref:Periphilin 1 n=1 Tax=Iconisemion striatum TaxID=60296 RepID=A0A1A7XBE8_9TELE